MKYIWAPPDRFSCNPTLPLLVWVSISGTFPIHLFVPILAVAARDFRVSSATIQWAITSYLIGLSSGQLVLGMLSDKFGRRPVLIGGLFAYAAGTLGTALAPSIPLLIVARFIQAFGGCSGLVLGRAITRDAAGPQRAVRQMAILSAAMTLGPGLAPLIGLNMAAWFGWRGMFMVLAGLNVLLLLAVILTLPETQDLNNRVSPRIYLVRYGQLLCNVRFLKICLGGAFATTSLYAFVANAPFILHGEFGLSNELIGPLFLATIGCLTLGNLVAVRLAGRVNPQVITRLTSFTMVVSTSAMLVFERIHLLGVISFTSLLMIFVGCIGMCSPFAITEAINVDPRAVGATSGLYGSAQMAAGAIMTAAVGAIGGTAVSATSIVMLGGGLIAVICFFGSTFGQRDSQEKIRPV